MPTFLQTPYLDIFKGEVYVTISEFKEVIVAYADPVTSLAMKDYITLADDKRILSGSFQDFIESGDKEIIVPMIDDEDHKHGGYRLLGFVSMKSYIPRKLHCRRGDIGPDFSKYDKDIATIPKGGGSCITSRDCFNSTGSCTKGSCVCNAAHMGSYCQMPVDNRQQQNQNINDNTVKTQDRSKIEENSKNYKQGKASGSNNPSEELPQENIPL
eukprot:gene10676-22283_t